MQLGEEYRKNFLNNIKVIKKVYQNNKDFFKTIGIDESTFSYWCSGKRKPRMESIIKIANAIGISLEDIFSKRIKVKLVVEVDE